VFTDLSAHSLCGDIEAATAYWGAGWAAVAFCLSLLLNSLDIADLRRWAALDIRVADGLIWITHRDAVVTLTPLADDGTELAIDEEGTVEDLDHIRSAEIVDVACNGIRACDRRTR
jgi:hypothetical protein